MSNKFIVRLIIAICSIVIFGGFVLGMSEVPSWDPNTSTLENSDIEFPSDTETIPVWESHWEVYDNEALNAQDQKSSCEFYSEYPEKSYQIYVDLGSTGTRAQHDAFFESHCS